MGVGQQSAAKCERWERGAGGKKTKLREGKNCGRGSCGDKCGRAQGQSHCVDAYRAGNTRKTRRGGGGETRTPRVCSIGAGKHVTLE